MKRIVSVDEHTLPGEAPFASLTSLVPDWSVSSRVTAFCTTRLGGVSQSPYAALNLGLHVSDDEECVVENRRRLSDSFALPASPCWLNQTHSSSLQYVVDPGTPSTQYSADGAWTDQPDVVLAILTADCLPIVISDTAGSQIAVVHAGWRGLADGIVENALKVFSPDAELHAWLGPAIGPKAFEVGEDVRHVFIARNPRYSTAFAPTQNSGKYLADLYALARAELQLLRNVTVTGGDYCTYTQADWFHSHRRDGVRSGRMATIAWLQPLK